MTPPSLRSATLPEVEVMLKWADAEGWNPGIDDAAAFFASDPDGFFVAQVDGHPVAAISVVNHSTEYAFLGLYLCLPEYRGRGIGYALWSHALAHAGHRTVGLDGVAAQEANYERSGFVRAGSTIRMEGTLDPAPDARVRALGAPNLDHLMRLDEAANGFARPAFLSAWLTPMPSRQSLVLHDAGVVTGFGTLRYCRDGIKIGPLIAPNANDALALARAGILRMSAPRVIIDVPSENTCLLEQLIRAGFVETFTTARTYRGEVVNRASNLQAIASMELG